MSKYILNEDNSYLLQENGDNLLLEQYPITFNRTLNFSGSINRNVKKIVVGTLSIVGNLNKFISTTFLGNLIVGGVMNKLYRMTIENTLLWSGVLTKKITKITAGILTFTGVLSAVKMLRYKIVSITIKCGIAVLDTLKLRRVR